MKRVLIVLILGMSCMWCKAQSNALSERKWSTQMRKAMEWVTQNLDNGAYKGQVSGGNRSGLGVYQWSDGTWCWGRWSNGNMNGKAIYIVPDGYGVVNCPGCVYYVGDYRSGRKSGTGTCYDKNGKLIYHGSFSHDRPTDAYPSSGYSGYKFECIEYSGGDVYIGETDNGVRHGYGIYLWSDGKAWYGPLENGERAGYGLFLPYKGNCQTGRWTGDTYTEVEQACIYCRGTGQSLCPVCSGRGGYMFYSVWMTCQSCMGRGKQMCMVCRGNGKRITGSTADEVFTKVQSTFAPAVTSYDGESPSSGSGGEESAEEIWERATAYNEAGEYAKAVPLYRQLAEQGYVSAQYNLGGCYANGEGVEKSYPEAVKWYRKAAEQGDASAQTNLGLCYENGRGVEKSYTEAVKWYRKAAEQGDASAQFNLGVCYINGEGVEKSYPEAVKWFRKAAEQGDATAQYNLGGCYINGEGVEKSYTEAAKWYRKAAEQGFARAQYNLGVCYTNGEGVEKSYAEAVKWYRKAAEQGDATAQYNLGVCYDKGKGVEENETEAVKWYRKAAEQGVSAAMYSLGVAYQFGSGVEKNGNKALYWYKKGVKSGNLSDLQQSSAETLIKQLEEEGYSADRAGIR